MEQDIISYNLSQSIADQNICRILMEEIHKALPESVSKIWHGSPVWFIEGNPIVGYSKLKDSIQLLFWSGQTFEEKDLRPVGKYKAAEVRYTSSQEIDLEQLSIWLQQSIMIQWDYKNIVKRSGELVRLK